MNRSAARGFTNDFKLIAGLVALIWVVFIVTAVLHLPLPGLQPRSLSGLVGIFTMPLLHADFRHLIGNTVPLVVLLCLLAGSRAKSWEIVAAIVIGGGTLLWAFGFPGNHVGASGLIFGLIAFLILSGFLERRFVPLLAAILTLFLYGGTLLLGVLPTAGSGVSWDGHLCGAVAGGLVAYVLVKHAGKSRRGAKRRT